MLYMVTFTINISPNLSIYSIHGSYGIMSNPFYPNSLDICEKQKRVPKTCHKIFKVKSIKFTIVHAFEPCNVGIRVVLRVVQT